jgi:hypothetical protein
MRLMILLTAGILSGCAANAPKVTWCVVDSRNDPWACLCRTPKGESLEIPIQECDGYIAMPPRDQEDLVEYIIDLEKKAARCR